MCHLFYVTVCLYFFFLLCFLCAITFCTVIILPFVCVHPSNSTKFNNVHWFLNPILILRFVYFMRIFMFYFAFSGHNRDFFYGRFSCGSSWGSLCEEFMEEDKENSFFSWKMDYVWNLLFFSSFFWPRIEFQWIWNLSLFFLKRFHLI